jgi:hypothetical protein
VEFKLDTANVPEGTVLLFGVRYPGNNQGRTYTYAMLKVNDRWYVTGGGRTPTDAGWGAIQRWLDSDGRQVAWVRAVTETRELWPSQTGLGLIDSPPRDGDTP